LTRIVSFAAIPGIIFIFPEGRILAQPVTVESSHQFWTSVKMFAVGGVDYTTLTPSFITDANFRSAQKSLLAITKIKNKINNKIKVF
jgi:hypothetical protein